jgi:periplasmic copper chaperone A
MNRSSVSLPRPLTRLATVVLATLTALAAFVALAGIASAHVTVSSQDAAPGGYGKLTFRVPNESDTASTVGLRIQIPEEAAMASLRVQPLPGWTATTTTSDLAEPLEAHGQEITSYTSVVEFRSEDGRGIRPGEFQEFALSGGPIPDAEALVFPTVQLYSDGSEVAWIEPSVAGQDEPERPAPVLTLTAGPETPATETAAAATQEDDSGTDAGTVALVVAGLALLVAIAGAVLGWRARRRTVSS